MPTPNHNTFVMGIPDDQGQLPTTQTPTPTGEEETVVLVICEICQTTFDRNKSEGRCPGCAQSTD